MVPVNITAVAVAALAQFIIGFLWHGPLFGAYWSKITGIVPTDAEKRDMWKPMLLGVLGALLTSYVLAHMITFVFAYTKTSGMLAGAEAGFWSWIGFVAPITLNLVLWERVSFERWRFANMYHLICLMVMGAIIGYMGM
jgi:hypothetical protein